MEGFCQLYLPKLNGRKVLGREKENMYRKDSEGWLKHADFIVLGENPVKNIRTLGHVEQVYKDGMLVSLPPIDQSCTD